MYAVIRAGGKQYRVQENDTIVLERTAGEAGAKRRRKAGSREHVVPADYWTRCLDVSTAFLRLPPQLAVR